MGDEPTSPSNQLELRPHADLSHTSALSRIRTCDLRFRRPTLYPLSYEGVCGLLPQPQVETVSGSDKQRRSK